MTLTNSVEYSLREAQESLRNALAYAARQERPMVCGGLADLLTRLSSIQSMDDMIDKIESHIQPKGDNGFPFTFGGDK